LEPRPDEELPGNIKLKSLEERIRKQFGVKQVKSCRWHRRNENGKLRVVADDDCEQDTASLVLYNPLDHDRTMCQQLVKGQGFVRVDGCTDTSWRLFAAAPLTANDAMHFPKVVVSSMQAPQLADEEIAGNPEEGEDFPCNVPCRKIGPDGLVIDRAILGTNWVIRYSMESSSYYPELVFDDHAHLLNRFYATTSFKSEIPLPYFSWAEYSIQSPAVDFDQAIKGASFIASNCESTNGREEVVKELMEHIRIHSLGSCLNNAQPPPGSSLDDKKSLQHQYLFHLAFENSNEADYVTEKLWGTFQAGTLPVYLGAPNIHQHAPPNSIISWHDFESTRALGEYLDKVAKDKELYESYHKWRTQPLPESFHKKFDFTQVHSICRICRWAHSRTHGYIFDHDTQTIQDPSIGRRICIDPDTQLVTRPVREQWLQRGQILKTSSADEGTCQDVGMEQSVQVGTWTRTVSNWDGALDITIQGTGEDGVYRLITPMTALESLTLDRKGPRRWQCQTSKIRMTLVTSWEAKFQSAGTVASDGAIGFELRGEKIMKMRVIFQDIDRFYAGGDKESGYFTELLVRDFFDPMELFLVDSGL
jgi:hypothetical protein